MKKLEFIKSKKLLNIDNNAKTVKGQKYGYMTAVLYLAPSNESGFNVCPMASQGCKKACLYTSGHGAFSSVKNGRINKTRWYIQERETFLDKIRKEINAFIVKAKKRNLIPCIRLNGTSDISWEKTGLIDEYKSIQWYDYTKIYNRALSFVNGELPSNYHLTYSLNEDNRKNAFDILNRGGNISAVFRKSLPKKYNGFKVVNADDSDLRFLDGDNIIAGLLAKGIARNDYSGFVLDS